MQCNKFSGTISKGLSKPQAKLFKQMIYGIQASKDVKLSNISRALKEDIPLIKTEDRLSRNMSLTDFTDHTNGHILRLGRGKINEEMVIAIDPGDIMKPYAKKMEHLCNVYDGSAHDKNATGYHLCQVTAANLAHDKIVPLLCEAYSSEAPDFPGITSKIKEIISLVKKAVGPEGTWTIDRQGDNNEIIRHFDQEKLQFVTRLKLNRNLIFKGKEQKVVKASNVTKHITLDKKATLTVIDNGKEKQVKVKLGAATVTLESMPDQWYTLVVVAGFGEKPMLLLTNKTVYLNEFQSVWRILEIYLTRWKCDECYRYIKQSYNLEDLRVQSYNAVRNIVVLVNAIAYFTSIYLGQSAKMKIMVNKIYILSQRFFGIPSFYHYAMADGIFELLKKTRKGVDNFVGKRGIHHNDFQLDLFPI
jgi:hypothetical protein